MASWVRWIVSWRAPAVLFAGVTSTILWIYSNRKDKASTDQNIEWPKSSVIEAVVFIHSKGVIHSDLAARQFLLDADFHAHLSDFGFSSLNNGDVLGFENSSHHMPRDIDRKNPSTTQSDLFALGSTLYEVMTGNSPYKGKPDDMITQLYCNGSFPDVTGVLYGHIIMNCWQGRYKTAAQVLEKLLLGSSVKTGRLLAYTSEDSKNRNYTKHTIQL